jgi:hypothetical protein
MSQQSMGIKEQLTIATMSKITELAQMWHHRKLPTTDPEISYTVLSIKKIIRFQELFEATM